MNTIAMARRLLRSVIPLIALGLVLAPVRPLADCDHLQCTRERNADANDQCTALGATDSAAVFAGAQCGYSEYLVSTWELYCFFNEDWQRVGPLAECSENCAACIPTRPNGDNDPSCVVLPALPGKPDNCNYDECEYCRVNEIKCVIQRTEVCPVSCASCVPAEEGGGGGGGGGSDGDECTLTAGQWCPITCVSCTVEQAN